MKFKCTCLFQSKPQQYLTSGPLLLSILQQVVTRKLPAMFDYHNIPAPWLQIKLIECLTLLAIHDKQYGYHLILSADISRYLDFSVGQGADQ